MQDRITDIEIKLMHHENIIQQLNEVVTRQELEIETLRHDMQQMLRHLQMITPSLVRDVLEEEPPPHY
ncbi:MAG: SlyX family protein [Deltaproteobacteria bacterium]|nr:SlyX family protein [Deltaproteobacteria bacterium]